MAQMEVRGEVTSPQTLGRLLCQARMSTGMSQRELAERLGISQRYVWEMEAGKPSLYTDRLFAFMRATDMRLTATLTIDDRLFDERPAR